MRIDWAFDLDATWTASVPSVPSGDASSAGWFEAAVPALVAQSTPVTTPCLVLIRVSTPKSMFAVRLHAKKLLDALHDQRDIGPAYATVGVEPPIVDDGPDYVRGLAIEWRSAERPMVEYRLGTRFVVHGEPVARPPLIQHECPTDGGSSEEKRGRHPMRVRFGRAVAEAWHEARSVPPECDLALVVYHRKGRGRDEDNTWRGWIGALAGEGWNGNAWKSDCAPLSERRLVAMASLVDPRISRGVRYELFAAPR